MFELIEKRTETTKLYNLGGNQRAIDAHIGAIHYKDNYADSGEAWKDIDLTWEGNKITKAPYELTLDGQKITVRDKKTGEISAIELLESKPAGLKWEIIPTRSHISFRHTLPTGKVPFEATFRVTGSLPLNTRAFDDDGELELETSLIDGVLTEKLSEVKDKVTGKVRPVKGNIRIDPTIDVSVAASGDDIHVYWNGSAWARSTTTSEQVAGYNGSSVQQRGGGMRFLNINIPNAATINVSYLTFIARANKSVTTVNTVIIGEKTQAPATFGTLANYQARRGTIVGGADDTQITSASVTWNAIPAWTAESSYNSPSIVTIVQEIVNLAGWVGDATDDMVLFWDDHANLSTNTAGADRIGASWDDTTRNPPALHIEYTAGTAWTKNLSDSVSISDSAGKAPVKVRSDAVTASDGFARQVNFIRSLTDASTIVDALGKLAGLAKADTSSVTDAIIKGAVLGKSDSITASDALAKLIDLSKADSVSILDNIALLKTMTLLLSDAVSTVDAIVKSTVLSKSDSVTATDSFSIYRLLVIYITLALYARDLTVKLQSRDSTIGLRNRSITMQLQGRSLTLNLPSRNATLAMRGK